MSIYELYFIKKFIQLCDDGWKQGWHECHGGNLTYRLTNADIGEVKKYLCNTDRWVPLYTKLNNLAGDCFVVTRSGGQFRNVIIDPEYSFGIIQISDNGEMYRILWGLINDGKPTSELSTHLMGQDIKKYISHDLYRVVYHAHPESIIALSFILPLSDEVFTRELWEMMPECAMNFPSGIGVLPWMVPGTNDIANKTKELMIQYDVVLWAQHGLFSSGETADKAFGLVNTIEKAASMLIKVLSVRSEKRTFPSADNFRDMAEKFELNLPERFLFKK